MNWKSIRQKIKTGDLYFLKASNLEGEVISLVTESPLVHVGIFVWIEGRLFCAESILWKGCHLELGSERLGDIEFVYATTEQSVIQEDAIKERIFQDVGKIDYDWKGVLLAPFVSTHAAQKYCAEWVRDVLGLRFPYLNRDVYPVDIYTATSAERGTILVNQLTQ